MEGQCCAFSSFLTKASTREKKKKKGKKEALFDYTVVQM
jgi:hypothetical protein